MWYIYRWCKYFCTEWWLWTVCIFLNIMLSQYGQYLQEAKVKIRIRTILDETKKKLDDYHCVLHVYLSVLCAHSQYLPAQSNVNLLDLLLGISTSNQGCHFLRWILKGHLKNVTDSVSFISSGGALQSSEPMRAKTQSPLFLNQDLPNTSKIPAWASEFELRLTGDQQFSTMALSQAVMYFKDPEIHFFPFFPPHSASNFEWCGPSSLPKLQLFC